MTLHSHYDPDRGRFIEHQHLHAGPHTHEITHRADGSPVSVVVKGPGNYSPHGLPLRGSEGTLSEGGAS